MSAWAPKSTVVPAGCVAQPESRNAAAIVLGFLMLSLLASDERTCVGVAFRGCEPEVWLRNHYNRRESILLHADPFPSKFLSGSFDGFLG